MELDSGKPQQISEQGINCRHVSLADFSDPVIETRPIYRSHLENQRDARLTKAVLGVVVNEMGVSER